MYTFWDDEVFTARDEALSEPDSGRNELGSAAIGGRPDRDIIDLTGVAHAVLPVPPHVEPRSGGLRRAVRRFHRRRTHRRDVRLYG